MCIHRFTDAIVAISQKNLLDGFGNVLNLRTIMADILMQDSPAIHDDEWGKV